MTPDAEIRLSVGQARVMCEQLLGQLGVGEDEARLTTNTLLEASLRGVDSHGLALLPVFAERIRSGQIRPGRRPFVRRDSPTSAWLDGQHGLGPPLATAAMELAAHKAARQGLGAVSLQNGNYVGALATYVEAPAREGLIALAMANATPRVAPLGGAAGLHGTNPVAWAAPTTDGDPLVFDAATGHAAARVTQAADEGRPIPQGMALDAEGRPTTDAAAAASGTLLPVGGALGYGLGLLVDVLTGGLAAAPMGREVPPVTAVDGPYGCSFFALVIDPQQFGANGTLAARISELCMSARQTTPAAGVDEVLAPGDRALRTRAERLRRGIPFSTASWQALLQRLIAADLDVSSVS